MMPFSSSHVSRWNSSSVDARTARSTAVKLKGGGSSTPLSWDTTILTTGWAGVIVLSGPDSIHDVDSRARCHCLGRGDSDVR